MASRLTWPSRLMSNTATGCCPGSALPAHLSVTFACTRLRYQAKGKSDTLRVIGPEPCGEPSRCPSGTGGGGGATRAVSVVGRSEGVGGAFAVLAIAGSSLSPAFGSAGARVGSARSGRPAASRARGGMSRGASRAGSSAARLGAGRVISSARGGRGAGGVVAGGVSARPCGEPTAATAGTRFTTYVFGFSLAQYPAERTTPAASEPCSSAENTVAVRGRRVLPRAGPLGGLIRSVAVAMLTSALAGGLGDHAEALDAGATDHVHGLDDGAVREGGVGLEVERLVVAAAEGVAQRALEPSWRDALLVQEQRAVLGHRQDETLLDRGGLGGSAGKIDVDPAVHHGCRQHEDEEQHQHHVDERHDVDLGQRGADTTTVAAARGRAKCHLWPGA